MPYDDKTMMTDMLSTQKFIASNYNNYAGEISTKQAKNKLMKILGLLLIMKVKKLLVPLQKILLLTIANVSVKKIILTI